MPTATVYAQPRDWSSLRTVTDVLTPPPTARVRWYMPQQATGRSLPRVVATQGCPDGRIAAMSISPDAAVRFAVLVPVKPPARGKSRLAGLPDGQRTALAIASPGHGGRHSTASTAWPR